MFKPERDREISGANTGLLNPKGIEITANHGLVLVAHVGDSTPGIFGPAAGDVAPIAVTELPGSTWPLDHHAHSDTANVALNNGLLAT